MLPRWRKVVGSCDFFASYSCKLEVQDETAESALFADVLQFESALSLYCSLVHDVLMQDESDSLLKVLQLQLAWPDLLLS